MSVFVAAIILATTLVTSFISGIFGMAGGIILMAVLVALVSVAMAMIIHGGIQMFANGYRAFLLRDAIDWRVFGLYCIGAGAGIAALFFVSWTPDKQALYLLLGLTPMLIWLPKERLHLDIKRAGHAISAGFIVQGLTQSSGQNRVLERSCRHRRRLGRASALVAVCGGDPTLNARHDTRQAYT